MKSLHNLIDKATLAAMQQDRQIRLLISRIVPADTVSHILYCRLQSGRLRLTVDNANWVARLRFCERQIVSALREARMDVVTLSFHVTPAEREVSREPERHTPPRSASAARIVEELAHGMSVDGGEPGTALETGADTDVEAGTGTAGRRSSVAEQPARFHGRKSIARRKARTSPTAHKRRTVMSGNSGDALRNELQRLASSLRGKS